MLRLVLSTALLCCWGSVGWADAGKTSKTSGPLTAGLTESSREIVAKIDEYIEQGWKDNEVQPSAQASDEEWLRRVYLDLVGHIPELEVVEAFLKDKNPQKRSALIEKLLDSPGYVRNFTTVWTNLAIGQQTPQRVSRDGMSRFFREAFARNRPWNDVVVDLITAEGHFEENGAVNYLLAQMQNNDDGVQATAKTTRLFLGVQVQCTQCHNHPFNKYKQDQFWEFNSFFRGLRKYEHQEYNPETGRREFKYTELRYEPFDGPVFFEKRTGEMRVANPKYFDKKPELSPDADRREALARLMVEGEDTYVARAMVNRTWAHFFGYGFTRPVDDMGPHNPPSHPELLEFLTREFVKHRYDVKQLIRWITNSRAYHLTSKFNEKNHYDNPAAGEVPLFSHMYVKSMTAEQLFDSLIIATQAHKSGRSNWQDAERQRTQWLQQFVQTFGTDEADESTTFNGTIPQALMMMNGPLVNDALSVKPGTLLHDVIYKQRGNNVQKVTTLFQAVLTRKPTKQELMAAHEILGGANLETAFQDLFWALLNSNEFIFVH